MKNRHAPKNAQHRHQYELRARAQLRAMHERRFRSSGVRQFPPVRSTAKSRRRR